MQARVWSEDSRTRIVNMFPPGSAKAGISKKLDEFLVEVGACKEHIPYLYKLFSITCYGENAGLINPFIISDVINSNGSCGNLDKPNRKR